MRDTVYFTLPREKTIFCKIIVCHFVENIFYFTSGFAQIIPDILIFIGIILLGHVCQYVFLISDMVESCLLASLPKVAIRKLSCFAKVVPISFIRPLQSSISPFFAFIFCLSSFFICLLISFFSSSWS